MLVLGLALTGYAACLQYVSLPEERTFARSSKRAALAVLGIAPSVLGSLLVG